jgi:hypothetical protein
MNTKLIIASLVSSFALIGAAQAQTPRGDTDNTPFQGVYAQNDSGVSRAQVVAELQQARANGATFGESDNAPFVAQADDGVSRAQVAGEISKPAIAFGDSDNVPFQG